MENISLLRRIKPTAMVNELLSERLYGRVYKRFDIHRRGNDRLLMLFKILSRSLGVRLQVRLETRIFDKIHTTR